MACPLLAGLCALSVRHAVPSSPYMTKRPLVVGEHRQPARIGVVMQPLAAQDEMAQHAAEGFSRLGG
jgi:hypothetical protein